ncbi:MAG: PKD domain-containing protein [Bacteroidetes bacterium]|nr:MAG: PKD domain-containing protein [Bacteroidota bacterium]
MKSIVAHRVLVILLVALASGLLFMRFSCNNKDKDKPTANFTVIDGYSRDIKVGDEVGFTSACIATSPFNVVWTFQGGYPSTSTDNQVIVIYNYSGSFTVKLCVTDTYGTDCLEKVGYITVSNSKDIVADAPMGIDDISN